MTSFKLIAGLTSGFVTAAAGIMPASDYIHELSMARDNANKMFRNTADNAVRLHEQARINAPYTLLEVNVAPARRTFAETAAEKSDLCDSDRVQLASELNGFSPSKLRRDTQDTQLACNID